MTVPEGMDDTMCTKNRDFVAYRASIGTGWEFFVPIEADTPQTLLDETYLVLERVGEALDSIFRPTGLEYTVHYGNGKDALEDLLDIDDGEMNRIDASDNPSMTRLRSMLEAEMKSFDPPVWLSLVQIDRGWTSIRLKDGEHEVDTSSNRYKLLSNGEPVDRSPTREPLTVYISTHLRSSSYRFKTRLWTYTDIWFEDTDIGATNRTRLGNAIERVRAELNVTEVEFHSESYSAEWLRKQGFQEIVPE